MPGQRLAMARPRHAPGSKKPYHSNPNLKLFHTLIHEYILKLESFNMHELMKINLF